MGVLGGESQLDPPSLMIMLELILPLLFRLLLKLLLGEVYTFNDSDFLMNFVRGLKLVIILKKFEKNLWNWFGYVGLFNDRVDYLLFFRLG